MKGYVNYPHFLEMCKSHICSHFIWICRNMQTIFWNLVSMELS